MPLRRLRGSRTARGEPWKIATAQMSRFRSAFRALSLSCIVGEIICAFFVRAGDGLPQRLLATAASCRR